MPGTESRTIEFPAGRSLGVISLRDAENPGAWNVHADASGAVAVPSGSVVRLCVGHEAASDLTPLSALKADDLQVLEITCNQKFEDAQLRHVEGLTGLLGLALWETPTGDPAFLRLSRLSNLRWLDVGDTRITGEGLALVRGTPYLEELTLLNTQVGDDGLHHLEGLDGLKRLDLMGTKVGDAGLEILRRLTALESLRIKDTDISYPAYAELKRALPDCQINYHGHAHA